MYQLGHQPTALGSLFQRLAGGIRPGAEFMSYFLRTHPTFPERSERVTRSTARLSQLKPEGEFILGRGELKTRSPVKLLQKPQVAIQFCLSKRTAVSCVGTEHFMIGNFSVFDPNIFYLLPRFGI
jgi:hypothetical protein